MVVIAVGLGGCLEAPVTEEGVTEEASLEAPTEVMLTLTPESGLTGTAAASVTPMVTATAQPTASDPGPSATAQEGHMLVVITASEVAWVRIDMDGENVFG